MLRRAMRRVLIKRLARESDRSMQQLLALRSIALKQVETQAALASRLVIDAPAANRLVAQLEKDGLVQRVRGRDRREVRLKVTAAAAPEIRAIRVGLEWLDAEMLAQLGGPAFRAMMESLGTLQVGLCNDCGLPE